MEKNIHIAILCAMPEEIGVAKENLANITERDFGDLKIFSGEWNKNKEFDKKIYISFAWSGWGKVSSARATVRMIALNHKNLPIDLLIFTGVAGSTNKIYKQWDIVIPNSLIQHDMDASPIFKKFVIPCLGSKEIFPPKELVEWGSETLKKAINKKKFKKFGKLRNGQIASGDKFVNEISFIDNLKRDLPEVCAVEMEGASVAQVAYQEKVPFLIIRVISDSAQEGAEMNFSEFISEYKNFSWLLMEVLIKSYVDKYKI